MASDPWASNNGEDATQLDDSQSEQARAINEAVMATQQAQYMQQMQFLQQMREHNRKEEDPNSTPKHGCQAGTSRFTDDYRPFKLCRFFSQGSCCVDNRRCIYAHTFEELHPASPDMPTEEDASELLTEIKMPQKL